MLRSKKSTDQEPNASKYDIGRQITSYRPSNDTLPSTPEDGQIDEPAVKARRFTFKRVVLGFFLLLLIPIIVFGVWNYRNAADASQKLFGSSNVLTALPPNSLKDTSGRTNILLIGYSADDPGHAGGKLTDSIMIVSLDSSSKTGYTLSIPRDLYVDIPDYSAAKINEAFQAGDNQGFNEAGYPAGGPGLLQKVIADTFEVPIDYYMIINYSSVRDITNALDGITVNITSSDPRGLYDPNFKPEEGGPLQLANGPQQLDGHTALRLTRARGSTAGSYGFPQSDFDRVQNQQKVFAAIKAKLSPELVINPLTNKPLFDAVANNIQTDIGLNQVLPIFSLFRSVPESSLKSINLRDADGVNYLESYRTSSGQSALIPAAGITDYSEIITLLSKQ